MVETAHLASLHVLVPGTVAFAYLSDPGKLGRWALGCFDTCVDPQGDVHEGTSLFDGGRGWFRIDADPVRQLIDYWLGEPADLVPRISTRVVDGPLGGYPDNTCLVLLTAWRPMSMPDARWARLKASHEAEIWLVKDQLEAAARSGTPVTS